MSKSKMKNGLFLGGLGVLMVAGIVCGIAISRNVGKSHQELSYENAVSHLD